MDPIPSTRKGRQKPWVGQALSGKGSVFKAIWWPHPCRLWFDNTRDLVHIKLERHPANTGADHHLLHGFLLRWRRERDSNHPTRLPARGDPRAWEFSTEGSTVFKFDGVRAVLYHPVSFCVVLYRASCCPVSSSVILYHSVWFAARLQNRSTRCARKPTFI